MKNIFCLLLSGAVLMAFGLSPVIAQTESALLRDLAEENKKSVEALVLYPSETRLAILETTKHPEVLIKMQDMREKTSAAFRTLIEDFPRTTQAVFYDLSRYSGMVESLVSQKNDLAALRKTLEALPEDQRDEAFGVVTRQMPALLQINDLNQTTHRAFERLIAGYSAPAQRAFEHLLGLPEVIDLLNEDLRFTILVGETYRDNPAWVIQKMDSLNLTVARAHAEELENWKSSLENDPTAKAELQSAASEYASEYASENGGDSEEYYGDDLYSDGNYADRDDDIAVRHYYEPYPYWYGYPYWQPFPRWHPYPWWWDWGFRPHGMVIVYLPSYHFTQWYFGNPHHHDHYNHLSTHFVNHYNGHRHSGTSISMGVHEWREQNRAVISDEFLADKTRLPERMKEYGRFEQGRQEFNTKNPRTPATQEVFLEKNAQKYPEIQRSRTASKVEIQRENEVTRQKRADWAPAKAPSRAEPVPAPKTERPARQTPVPTQKQPNRTQPPTTREPAPNPRTPRTEQPARTPAVPAPRTRPDEAKDYNRQKWGEQKTPQETRPSAPAPARQPRTAPQKTEKSRGRGN